VEIRDAVFLEERGQMGAYASTDCINLVPELGMDARYALRSGAIGELDDMDGLVKNYRAKVLRFVTYSTGDPDLAETITQDTLLKAHLNRDRFRGECSVKTWLTGIAINLTRDHMRSAKFKFWKQANSQSIDVHEMASFLPGEEPNPERQVLAKERVGQLSKVIEALSRNQRTVFLMKFLEEIPVNEISEILGMPVNTVRTHLHRALNSVRSQMGVNL
jgi:RNA polymerase sigma-70 factor, ECF subfamily